ncbi:MAG: hypothetical protein J0M04_13720 [Verrucomicrobia bacterium]|nr:hypothetical protein [Verrucomicrobiota bacterium]
MKTALRRLIPALALPLLLLWPVTSTAQACYAIEPPYDPMWLTAYSKNIFVIEVTKVAPEDPVVKNGCEHRRISFSGKVVETVRGKAPEKEFSHDGFKLRIVDHEKAREAAKSEEELQILELLDKSLCGAEGCEVGERYLVVQCKLGEFFALLKKDDETWRSQIREEKDGL